MQHAVDIGFRVCAVVDLFQPGVRLMLVHPVQEVRREHLGHRLPVDEVVGLHPFRQRHIGLSQIALQLGARPQGADEGKPRQRLDQACAQKLWQLLVGLKHFLLGIARISAEEFVAAVTRQHDLVSIRRRFFCAEIGGDGGVVGEGLVVVRGDDRDRFHDVGGLQVVLVHVQAEMPAGRAGIVHLVEAFRREADGIGARLAGDLFEHARHRGTVGSAGEEGGHLIPAFGSFHSHADQFEKASLLRLEIVARLIPVFQRPVEATCDSSTATLALHPLPRQQLLHSAIDAARCRHNMKIQIVEQALRIQAAPQRRMRRQQVGAAGE